MVAALLVWNISISDSDGSAAVATDAVHQQENKSPQPSSAPAACSSEDIYGFFKHIERGTDVSREYTFAAGCAVWLCDDGAVGSRCSILSSCDRWLCINGYILPAVRFCCQAACCFSVLLFKCSRFGQCRWAELSCCLFFLRLSSLVLRAFWLNAVFGMDVMVDDLFFCRYLGERCSFFGTTFDCDFFTVIPGLVVQGKKHSDGGLLGRADVRQ